MPRSLTSVTSHSLDVCAAACCVMPDAAEEEGEVEAEAEEGEEEGNGEPKAQKDAPDAKGEPL